MLHGLEMSLTTANVASILSSDCPSNKRIEQSIRRLKGKLGSEVRRAAYCSSSAKTLGRAPGGVGQAVDALQHHWESDPAARLYPSLARWLPLGLATLLVVAALESGSAGATAFLLAFAAVVGVFGVLYARWVRSLESIGLTPEGDAMVLVGNGWTETVALSRVTRVQFGKYGAIITVVTSSPSRQYMISLLDESRSSLKMALENAGLLVGGS